MSLENLDIRHKKLYGSIPGMAWYSAQIGGKNGFVTEYAKGAIVRTAVRYGEYDPKTDRNAPSGVLVEFSDGTVCQWESTWFGGYNGQFGVSVSPDGRFVFAQSWERGLCCLDARTGAMVWKTASRRGITNVYVNGRSVLVHQREQALLLLDMETGAVIMEKRPARAWGFDILEEGYIFCFTTARQAEIIRTEDLETVEQIPAKLFPRDDWCVKRVYLADGKLKYEAFRNVWDESRQPPKMLPNEQITGEIPLHCFG